MYMPAQIPVRLKLKTAGWLGICGGSCLGVAAEGVAGVEPVLSLPSEWC